LFTRFGESSNIRAAMNPLSSCSQAYLWLLLCAVMGTAMLLLFDDSCQMDGGQHHLFARWAWVHSELFVGVWSRPLFTFVYAFPAAISFRAARAFTILVCLAIGWQTWRLGEDLKIRRAPFSIILLFLQPSFFLFCADTMTEPIFALTFVVALRLHHRGWVKAGMIVASFMVLARPEGFFLGVLWGIWVLRIVECGLRKHYATGFSNSEADHQSSEPFNWIKSAIRNPQSAIKILWLATGSVVWWFAATLITGDALFIKHNWPSSWPMTGTMYGAHGLLAFPSRLPEATGLFLLPVFLYGLVWLLRRKQLFTLTSSFLLIFVLHTILRAYGLMGSAGYPRYLVAISPAIALITLSGWNALAKLFAQVSRPVRIGCVALLIAVSIWTNFVYADGAEWSRDARAIAQAQQWFKAQPDKPAINRFIWSKPYACILFDHDPWENPAFTRNHEVDQQTLREMPSGTLAVWDELAGPKEFNLRAADFEAAGFTSLYTESFILTGYVLNRSWFGFGGPRQQTIYLLYKR